MLADGFAADAQRATKQEIRPAPPVSTKRSAEQPPVVWAETPTRSASRRRPCIREVSVAALDKRIDEASYLNQGWRVVKDAYTDTPADVNKGVGGKFIYLLYRV